MNIEASSLLLDTTITEKRFYQYNKFLLDGYQYCHNLHQSSSIGSSLLYSCLLNEFSDTRRSRSLMSEYLPPKPPNTPVSPLLFVIYLSVLHMPIPRWSIFSYVDDFVVTVGSLSYLLGI